MFEFSEQYHRPARRRFTGDIEAGPGLCRYASLGQYVTHSFLSGLHYLTKSPFLLSVWPPMALPALKLVLPALRYGAVVITDNSARAADRYKDLLGYLRAPENGFRNLTLPYNNGLEMSVYTPSTGPKA